MTTRFVDHLIGPDVHANRPAPSAVPTGTLYSCSEHQKVYRNDGTAWTDYLILGSTSSGSGSTMTPNAQTTDYTLVSADAGKAVEMTSASALVLTVPPNSSVAFPIGTIIDVYQGGAGNVSVAAGAGVTIRNLAPLSGQYAEASLRKRATDEWVLTGDTVASSAPSLKDYAEVYRSAGDITLNQTAITPVHTALDLTVAAAAGDLISYGISGILSAVGVAVCFDVYTMPSGSTVNPFGVGLSASNANVQGVPGWEFGTADTSLGQLSGEITRVLTAADVAGGLTTLRLLYAKNNTTARTLFAQANIPLKVWAKNHGQV